jgi:hypothetical protein
MALGFACGCGAGDKPTLDVRLVTLKDATSTAVPQAEIPHVPVSRPCVLSIPIPGHMGNAALEVRILDERDEVVWVGVGLRRTEAGTGQILLPAHFLEPGDYTLAVGRAQPGVRRGQFPFRAT